MSSKEPFIRLRKMLNTYISRYPIPSATSNNILFIKLQSIKDKNSLKYKELRDYIIISNGGFALKYSMKYCRLINDDKTIDDIFQQAQLGIAEATDRFDPLRGVNFTTFAYHYVKKCIIDYIKQYKTVLAPREVARNMKPVSEIQDKLFSETANQPTAKEIKKGLKEKDIIIKENIIEDIIKLRGLTSADTSNSFMCGLTDDIEDEEGNHETGMLLKYMVLKDLDGLDEKCIKFISLRFGINQDRPFNLSEIKLLMTLTNEEIEELKETIKLWMNNKIVKKITDKI